jgi:beta-lactamase class A
MMQRRRFATAMLASAAVLAVDGCALMPSTSASRARDAAFDQRVKAIEAQSGGRLGVSVFDTATGRRYGHRADERFPMCSTFKMLAVALVLYRVDRNDEKLERRVRFDQSVLVPYSPVTSARVGGDGMTLAELCEAAITASDNTAGNLLLASFGGPPALTAYARTLGDPVTRLDRNEVELNEATPGDPRDTTTPAAMLSNLRALVLGSALSAGSRNHLRRWMVGNTTGGRRIRAGLPTGWVVADKTGSGNHGTANDIGIIWPPGREPVLAAAYLTGTAGSDDERDAALADVGRALASAFASAT